MRIKIIGDNNCARATRHLLRLAGFAVSEFLPADAVADGPLAGYAITIELAPALYTPDAHLRPDPPTHHSHTSGLEEAGPHSGDASSPSFAVASPGDSRNARIHFDSVDSALEAAVLRHVTQLAAAPVIVDRPGGKVHSERELRIVVPASGDAGADESAAVAVEFGVLRGLLDLAATSPVRDAADGRSANFRSGSGWKKWWPFWILCFAAALGFFYGERTVTAGRLVESAAEGHQVPLLTAHGKKTAPLAAESVGAVLEGHILKSVRVEAQGQFETGQGLRITDGTDFFVVDPCKGQTKLFASISQTGNTLLVAGSASKKMYVCSIHLVAAAAADVAVVEGTGSVCGTGTAGVSGFGGATAATGWNFAANGGIALGNGDSSLGAEGVSGDDLCVFSSGSGQVSGGISYVVQ